MIKIVTSHFNLLISGHEVNNNENKLVCCAVSSISLTAINCFRKKDLSYYSKYGILKVHLRNRSIKNRIMWEMLINQLYLLYKENKETILWKRKEI